MRDAFRITGDELVYYLHSATAFLCHAGIGDVRNICVLWERISSDSKGYLVLNIVVLVHRQIVVERAELVSKILAENAGWGFHTSLSDLAVIHSPPATHTTCTLVGIAECKRGSNDSQIA